MLFWVCATVLALSASADAIKVKFPSGNQTNFDRKTRIAVGDEAGADNDFIVTCTATSRCETAWRIVSERMSVPPEAIGYAFDFEIYSDSDWLKCGTSDSWGSAITWYDGKGEKISKQPIEPAFRKQKFARFRFSGKMPPEAAAVTVQIGVDGPDVPPGEKVVVRKAEFTPILRGNKIPPQITYDVTPPLVYSRFNAPSA